MPRALFTSKNLIGDGLYIQPSLEVWAKEHPDWEIDLLTLNDHITQLYSGMGIPNLQTVFERAVKKYDFEFDFQVNQAFDICDKEKIHIADAYAKMLGVKITSRLPKYTPPEGPSEAGLILLSMFSNSCASRKGKPPNKMLSGGHWALILALVRQYGNIAILGGPDDRVDSNIEASEDEYYCGIPLDSVARIMRDAKLIVTIDNGMSHLATTQGTPMVLFYPAVLGEHYIKPPNPNMVFRHMNPMTFTGAQATQAVREGLQRFVKD